MGSAEKFSGVIKFSVVLVYRTKLLFVLPSEILDYLQLSYSFDFCTIKNKAYFFI